MHVQLMNGPFTLLFLQTLNPIFAAPAPEAPGNLSSTVSIRIEGPKATIYEGLVTSGPRYITVSQNGGTTFYCDGTNDNVNPKPGNTCLDALDAAAKAHGFTYDGGFDGEFNDFYITRIATVSSTPSGDEFWGLLLNYQISKFSLGLTLSGCQQEVKAGDKVLYAFLPYNTTGVQYLEISPRKISVKRGEKHAVKVFNGMNGVVVQGAEIDGVTTNENGLAELEFPHIGTHKYKATKAGDVRSAPLTVVVT